MLSAAQRKALERIERDGELHAHNGVTANTVASLANRGLVTVEWLPPTRQYGPRGSAGYRGRLVQNWVARPVAGTKDR